ncbi:condensation domain-containing protein [Micromonospora sp. BRA006-A]|nr:condensation domain-containing protein [Micromonospora sp. BRA006-A]
MGGAAGRARGRPRRRLLPPGRALDHRDAAGRGPARAARAATSPSRTCWSGGHHAASPPAPTPPPEPDRPTPPCGDGHRLLSPAQQRLWFLDRYFPAAASASNVAFAERITGPLDVAALATALTAVADRQQILRWRIPERDGVPYAVADPAAPVPLPVRDLARAPTSPATSRRAPPDRSRWAPTRCGGPS